VFIKPRLSAHQRFAVAFLFVSVTGKITGKITTIIIIQGQKFEAAGHWAALKLDVFVDVSDCK
jgi:hypothetical protein